MNIAKFLIGFLSITVPLTFIAISAFSSGWFNLFENALSDLGHALNSDVAWIFNLGLASGGFLIVCFSAMFVREFDIGISMTLMIMGYFLTLIAVFDEIYGFIHFIVSAVFFITLLFFILVYTMKALHGGFMITVLVIIIFNISVWLIHLLYKIPRGVAIPELLSILSSLPFYIHMVYKISTQ
ncbi:MAG: DUF998 domain-containing protein [Desulfurococcaceae archaeon]